MPFPEIKGRVGATASLMQQPDSCTVDGRNPASISGYGPPFQTLNLSIDAKPLFNRGMSTNGRNPASRICVINIDIRGVRGGRQSTCHALLAVAHARFCPPTVSANGFLTTASTSTRACLKIDTTKPGVALASAIMRRTRGTDRRILGGLASGGILKHRNGVMDYFT